MSTASLRRVIITLNVRIRDHRSVLQSNETRTRMVLIDPLLVGLGWDTADPSLVLGEYDVSGYRADYALLNGDGKPIVFIEAKRLGVNLTLNRMQVINYANITGVPYAVLTDGNRWELYDVFDQKPIDERCLLRVCLADQTSNDCASFLSEQLSLTALSPSHPQLLAKRGTVLRKRKQGNSPTVWSKLGNKHR